MSHYASRLQALTDNAGILRDIGRGLEKESLRITADGNLAQTPHPKAFGSALSHSSITTDFSEALLEFITPVHRSVEGALAQLDDIHRFVYSQLDDELLWTASMPCMLSDDSDIPVAQYGSSNLAQQKTTYRLGLGHRYGRKMQTIAGIHYNFSAPAGLWQLLYGDNYSQEQVTDAYFGLIRNFRRWSWLLVYLFGAAPAVCQSFLKGREHQLQTLAHHSLGLPFGTSLRMGDLGYQSKAQENLKICYNGLSYYIDTLREAITQPHADYQGFPAGEQLSDALLQIENEFYSPIRPKRVGESGEIPIGALQRAGVEYIEVRCVDVNPYQPNGIDAEQIRFMDAFLLYCLLQDSPACNDEVYFQLNDNLRRVVNAGREPGLRLQDGKQERPLTDWALELIEHIGDMAALLDQAWSENGNSSAYAEVCQAMRARVEDPALTPSARMLADTDAQGLSHFQWLLAKAREHRDHFLAKPLNSEQAAAFAAEREASIAKQAAIEAADEGSFKDFLARFYQQYQGLS